MIKFFRTIRQKLISENKFSRYLIYAFGEIFLVVIGILIALQINNWNEYKRTVSLAESFISDIQKDLMTDTLTFEAAIQRIHKTISNNKSLLDPVFVNEISKDSIISLLKSSYHSTRIYHIDNATYLKLSNTGFVEPEVYNSVFTEINNYYNKEYVAYSEFIEWDEDQSIDLYNSDFLGPNTTIDLSSLDSENSSAIDLKNNNTLKEFIQDSHFRNSTWANMNRKEAVLDRLLLQKQLAVDLIKRINQELN